MKKLNILLMPHWMGVDGSGIYFKILAIKLLKRLQNVTVYSRGGKLVSEIEKENIKHRKFNTLRLSLYPFSSCLRFYLKRNKLRFGSKISTFILIMDFLLRWSIFWLLEILRFLRSVKNNKIDIIHSHGPSSDLFAFICSYIMKTPWLTLVGSPTSDLPLQFTAFGRNVKKIIAISDESKNAIIGHCSYEIRELIKKKIVVMPNFIDTKKFAPPKSTKEVERYLKELNIPPNKKNIVLISRISSDKEIPISSTIKAASRILKEFPDSQIIIVGTGKLFKDIARLVEDMNTKLGQKVVFMTGLLKDVEKAMKIATVVIAVGQTATEAMACGKPVIIAGHLKGSKGGSFGGIVNENSFAELKKHNFTGRNSLIITDDTQIANACIKLLGNEKLRNQLEIFGRSIAKNQFDMERGISEILRIYYSLLR